MVINNNEKEFKGKTLQEYLEWKYPEKEDKESVREIKVWKINEVRERGGITEKVRDTTGKKVDRVIKLEGGELDLRGFVNVKEVDVSGIFYLESLLTKLNASGLTNLTELECSHNNLTSLDVSNLVNLVSLSCCSNNFTSANFLNQLPNPEKLERLTISNNRIGGDLTLFVNFVNLKKLQLGNVGGDTGNYFHGSLEPLKNMTKLSGLCIERTDIDTGLEYLPMSLAQASKGRPYPVNFALDCIAGKGKVIAIQDQLRKYDYDIEAWQLAHPQLMFKSRPELFTQPNTKTKWLQAVKDKIQETALKLRATRLQEDKEKKVKRLESKLRELELIEKVITPNKSQKWLDKNYPKSERGDLKEIVVRDRYLKSKLDLSEFRSLEKITTLIELENSSEEEVDQIKTLDKKTENQATQTDLTSKQIVTLEQIQLGVKELAKK